MPSEQPTAPKQDEWYQDKGDAGVWHVKRKGRKLTAVLLVTGAIRVNGVKYKFDEPLIEVPLFRRRRRGTK